MERHIILTLLFCGSLTAANKLYRSDYTYNKETGAFYKFHTESLPYRFAQSVCKTEGSRLMVVSSEGDLVQVHGILKQFPDIAVQVWIGEDVQHHEPGEETYILDLNVRKDSLPAMFPWARCEAITQNGDKEMLNCFISLPFLCKVEAKDAFFDSRCSVFGKNYEYFANVGSCYKFSQILYSWNQAYADCVAQGAHLVVINSELEHRVIHNMTRWTTRRNDNMTWFFAGLRANQTYDGSTRIFKTVNGQTPKEAGYDQWSVNELNNALGKKNCGSIFEGDGKYDDRDCYERLQYICEKEVISTK